MAVIMDEVQSLVQIIGGLANKFNRAQNTLKTSSLTEVTKLSRVEPLTIVSRDCISLDYLPDVLQTLLSIFAGYYLQAAALSAQIDSVKVVKVLDRLNPDRDSTGLITSSWFSSFVATETMKDIQNISAESYKYRLPTSRNQLSLEEEAKDQAEKKISAKNTVDNDGLKALNEMSNLAVGKLLNVDIHAGEQKMRLPVSIRLSPAAIPNQSIVHILALKTDDNSLLERFHAWRSGRIDFIKDLILCQDLIDQHKAALMHDEAGTYSEIIRRVNNAKRFGLMTGNPSLVSASNLFVLSETVAKEVEMKLGGKLSNPRTRQKAFENTYAMIIAVVDREYERITFYHRGIAAATEVSVREIKNSAKTKGPDILDVFKMLSQGSAPSF